MKQDRLAESILIVLQGFSPYAAYGTIFGVLFACGLGLPIPEDITLIAAGMLSATENISFAGACIVGFLGVLSGDCLLFFLGRHYGRRIFKFPGFRRIFTESRLEAAEVKLHNKATYVCFTARFLPGLRAPVFLMAGVLKVKPWRFLIPDGLAALISVPAWVWVGHFFGDNLEAALRLARQVQGYILGGIAIAVVWYLVYRVIKKRRAVKLET